jgi:hypothetical protein
MDAMRRHDRGARVGRGAVAASLATFVALVSHVSAGGVIPGPVGVLVPLLLSFVVSVALAGRRLSVWRLGLSVVVSQALFHTLFVLGSYDLGAGAGAGAHAHGDAVPVAAGGSSSPVLTVDADMAAGHLVAVVVTTLALHRGERTLAGLRALARACVAWVRARVRVSVFIPASVRRVRAAVVATVPPVSTMVVRASARRGPPVAAS